MLELRIPKSKTDPAGHGTTVRLAIATAPTPFCPLQSLVRLLQLVPDANCFVFADAVTGGQLQPQTLRNRLRHYLAGIMAPDLAKQFSLHSLRRGGATALFRSGVRVEVIQRMGRWKSDAVDLYALLEARDQWWGSQHLLQAMIQPPRAGPVLLDGRP
jgi:integrase